MSTSNLIKDINSLQGKFLISSPIMPDNRFNKSVIYITNYSMKGGANGIVINKPSAHKLFHIAKNIKSDLKEEDIENNSIPVVLGGPVNTNNVFILHSNEYFIKGTIKITEDIYMTNHPNIIIDMISHKGPLKSLISIGCSNWVAGQLEKELIADSWLVSNIDSSIIFNVPFYKIWEEFYQEMKIPTNVAFFNHSVEKI